MEVKAKFSRSETGLWLYSDGEVQGKGETPDDALADYLSKFNYQGPPLTKQEV